LSSELKTSANSIIDLTELFQSFETLDPNAVNNMGPDYDF
jgi:hypothetical protein